MGAEVTSNSPAKHIEWTGAGGDYYLAIVVDERSEVIEEYWGTQEEVRRWIAARSPQMPATYVPMALGAARKRARRESFRH